MNAFMPNMYKSCIDLSLIEEGAGTIALSQMFKPNLWSYVWTCILLLRIELSFSLHLNWEIFHSKLQKAKEKALCPIKTASRKNSTKMSVKEERLREKRGGR